MIIDGQNICFLFSIRCSRIIILLYNRLINMNTNTTPNIASAPLEPIMENIQLPEELPGMKEVLINSLRINKKLHGEIVAREHSVRNEAQQANLKLHSLYRDMEEVYGKTQQLYEETVRQNQKTRYMAEELLKPFREELKGKVDQTTLSLKMKMMLSEFDNLGHKISYDRQGRLLEGDDNHTFHFVRTQLLPLICRLEQQLKEKTLQGKKQEEQLVMLHSKQEDLTKDLAKSREMVFEVKASLIDELTSKLSDEVWNYRFNNFYETFIRTSINPIAHTLNANHKQLTAEIQHLKTEMSSLLKKNNYDTKISQNSKRIDEVRLELGKLGRSSASNESAMAEFRKNLEDNKIFFQKQLNRIADCTNKEQISHLLEQNKSVKAHLDVITVQLQSQLERAIQSNDKSIAFKVAKLESEVKVLAQHAKHTHKQLQSEQQEITLIKELLSKKANFTDIIVHTENKADKQDYQELRNLLHANSASAPLQYPSEEQDSCMITQEEPREEVTPTPNRFRKRQSTSGRKNAHQHSVSPFVPDSDRDDSVKRYMLGLKNGASNYTRENLLKEKTKFMFLNQTERRQPKNVRRGETFTENFV